MVLEKLGQSLKDTLAKVAKAVFVDEKLINELIKDIQRALLQSDVNVRLVFELTSRIKEKVQKADLPPGLSKKEFLIKTIYDELVQFLGGEGHKIEVGKRRPYVIMFVGLFGNGKTTHAGKLAKFFSKRGSKVAILGLDIHRPAAMDQLEQIAGQVKVPVFIDRKEKDPLRIYAKYRDQLNKFDIVLVDTAGRDALSDDLITEINAINTALRPDENLLVIGADVGQAAERQARAFHESCGVSGVIISKMDGTAKGGGALIACSVTGAPVKFIGVGEKPDDLEEFRPKSFVSRLLGMGDIELLLEKAKGAISEADAEDLGKRVLKGEFNLIDLFEQMQAMKKMGSLQKIMELIPGMGQLKLPKEALDVQEGKLEKWKHIMNSCTRAELEDPETIDGPRAARIAKGAGVTAHDVRELVKQYRQTKRLMKTLGGSQKGMEKMMKRMGGLGRMMR
ncbi:signal recognition particle protein [Candidatus Woesearchaeota archaeon]|nr:signal recognition particle protein [Candidatus Woesearchaeota archaeon]